MPYLKEGLAPLSAELSIRDIEMDDVIRMLSGWHAGPSNRIWTEPSRGLDLSHPDGSSGLSADTDPAGDTQALDDVARLSGSGTIGTEGSSGGKDIASASIGIAETLEFEFEPTGPYDGTTTLAFSGATIRADGSLNGTQLIQISRFQPLEVVSLTGEDFDFSGALFAAGWSGTTVTVAGWDDGVQVGSVTFALNAFASASQSFGPQFSSIDRLVISASRTVKLDDMQFVTYPAQPNSSTPDLLDSSDTGASPTDNLTRATEPTFRIDLDPAVAAGTTVELLVDGVSVAQVTIGDSDLANGFVLLSAPLAEGEREVAARVSDANGSSVSDLLTVTIDRTPAPASTTGITVWVDGPSGENSEQLSPGGVTSDRDPMLRGAALDAGVTVSVFVDGTFAGTALPSAEGGWQFTFSDLDDGDHVITIMTEDEAGNTATSEDSLILTVEAAAAGPEAEPLYAEQWHLAALGDIGAVWADYTGEGIVVAVYDDGVEYSHPDLDDNYIAALQLNDGLNTYDAAPTRPDEAVHGTAVAGVIAAEANGEGTVGIAYEAGLVGVNIFSGPLNINSSFSEFDWAIQQMLDFDVVNHSWGAAPVYLNNVGGTAAAEMQGALDAARFGRDGLGTVILKAAGNWADSAQGDYYDTTRWTITVAAYDSDGDASWYTNRGANVLVSAPSSGNTQADANGTLLPGSDLRIATTDRDGGFGYAADAWSSAYDTSGFGGTSSATPTVAGVVALMLDANPGLGWRDVQTILAYSARETGSATGVQSLATEEVPVDLDGNLDFETTALQPIEFFPGVWNGADNWNGGGLHFSEDYGFGATDVFNAVRMAEVWSLFGPAQTSANEATAGTGLLAPNLAVSGEGDSATYDFTYSGPAMELEYVDISIGLSSRLLQEVNLTLTSPEGTTVTLLDPAINDYTPAATLFGIVLVYFDLDWTFGAHAFKGEDPNGVWQVTLTEKDVTYDVDLFAREADGSILNTIELDFYGRAEGQFGVALADDVYHYTDEILTLDLAAEAERRELADEGGIDWLDLAAVTADLAIDLTPGASSFADDGSGPVEIIDLDGAASATTVIENAVTGDGDDSLLGNQTANTLAGMRGDDTLTGGAEADTFFFTPGFGDDRITDFGDGADVVWLSGFAETAFADLTFDATDPSVLLLSSGDTVTFGGVSAFSSDDFLFDELATV